MDGLHLHGYWYKGTCYKIHLFERATGAQGQGRLPLTIEEEYGKIRKIINAHVNNILELHTVTNTDPKKVNNFYKTLLFNIQSLETLGKIKRANGMTRGVLDKLKGIKDDLVRGQLGCNC